MITFEPYSILFYCFGIIIPTIMLLFSYGNFAYKIGEYVTIAKNQENLPMIIFMILTKLFIMSFIMFYVYHYIFDDPLYDKTITLKIIFWGLIITIDGFLLNKELGITCKYFSNIIDYKKFIYEKEHKFHNKYKLLFWLRNSLIFAIIILFIFNFANENLSFTLIFLIAYIYYNCKIDKYINSLQEYDE